MAQEYEHNRAIAFDRGLTNVYEPFAPSGNPALLALKDRFRFHVESVNPNLNSFGLSLVYPMSPFTGFGFTYFSQDVDEIKSVPQGIFRVMQKNQSFIMSFGYNSALNWGQYFELGHKMDRFSSVSTNKTQNAPFLNKQEIQFSYRFGLFRELNNKFSVGLLTDPILNFNYQIIDDEEREPSSELSAFKKHKFPMLGVQWSPTSPLTLALSSRSQYGSDDVQLALEVTLKRLLLTGAVYKKESANSSGWILGAGTNIGGVDIYSSYNWHENYWSFSASFSPERNVELVQVSLLDNSHHIFYPYRLRHNAKAEFLDLNIKRKVENPIAVYIKLFGKKLPGFSQELTLNESETLVNIPVPAGLENLNAGTYNYTLEVTAHQRNRQKVTRSVALEIMDKHIWSGDVNDLVYFLTPDAPRILTESKRLALLSHKTNTTPDAVEIAKNIYNYIQKKVKYLNDPKLVNNEHDWVQYPVETLEFGSGDCEDMSILFASMLQSVGINSAFAEYVVPGSENGHVFVLFDSNQKLSELLDQNENIQNYIVRPSINGHKYYVPIELTKTELSFTQSRKYAIAIYNKYAVEQKGLANGWFHIIDVH